MMTTASTLPAVAAAGRDALAALKEVATGPGGSFEGLDPAALDVAAGTLQGDSRQAGFAEILARHRLSGVTGEGSAAPGDERQEYRCPATPHRRRPAACQSGV